MAIYTNSMIPSMMSKSRLNLVFVSALIVIVALYMVAGVAAVQFGIVNPPNFVIPLGNGSSIEAALSHNTQCLLPWMSCDYYDGPPISRYAIFSVQRTSHSITATPIFIWHVAPRYPNDRERTSNLPSAPPPTIAPFPSPAATMNPYP